MLYAYCDLVLYKYPHLKTIIGIATEPPPDPNHPQKLFSEDMIMLKAPSEWSKEHLEELDRLRKHFDIMREERFRISHFAGIEYPEEPPK
jgi:hypothetical protein